MVDADHPNWRAIKRNEHCVLSPLEISSRSKRLATFRQMARDQPEDKVGLAQLAAHPFVLPFSLQMRLLLPG